MFDCSEGRLPFVLFVGHGSRTDFEFLKDANDASHKRVICIGVSCGTGL